MEIPIFLVRAHSFEEVSFKKDRKPTRVKTDIVGQGLDFDVLVKKVENAYSEIDDIKYEMVSIEEVEQGVGKKPKVLCWFKYGDHGWEKAKPVVLLAK